ncbi:hypothetical protein [Stenotrophomonas sp. S39]|uniref:hypothetical protein n=1 Tax=Stenotrophomonas sp. S39 TaxID=2767451 RepID=UPI0019094FE0|nr:hypothetical protein [Stenotrophomonas sp. S39]MBK0052633.1 hypothetical protein [Stenotrophomonas sp. S39]
MSLRFLKTRQSSWQVALPRLRSPAMRTTCNGKGGMAMLPADDGASRPPWRRQMPGRALFA